MTDHRDLPEAGLASKALFAAGLGVVAVGRVVESRRRADPDVDDRAEPALEEI